MQPLSKRNDFGGKKLFQQAIVLICHAQNYGKYVASERRIVLGG
jgi:hypothetical protein